MPVVSSSSPPDSHGVGSTSSEMCTQRTGFSAPAAPATRRRSSSETRSPRVSMALGEPQLARRALERGAQDRLHLRELLRTGDERRRELHDGVAAVVGAADQPAAEELAREVVVEQVVALLLAELLLGRLVLDELDRVEVAHSAHVTD